MKRFLVVLVVLLSVISLSKTTITFWHAMSGRNLAAVDNIVKAFNESQNEVEVVAQFTGSYAETLTKAIAAYRTGTHPNIVQVYEVGLQTMLDSGAILPVYQLAEPGFDWGDVVKPILNYYAVDGQLYSMPFNSSTAILYYNKDIFEAAGLDPSKPPSTFNEILEYGKKIVASGASQGGISFGWPAWVFEQMHATHAQFYANNENGRKAKASEVLFNAAFGQRVFVEWMKWAQEKVFVYGGREYSANTAFLTGQVAMLIQSTSSVGSIQATASFRVGTSFLPRLPEYPRGNSVIGGATIWVLKGKPEAENKAVWEFLKYVMRPDVSKQWHQSTGYFPSSNTTVKLLMDEGWFADQPNHLTAFLQILSGADIPPAQGVRLGNFVAIRDVVDSAVEKAVQYRGTDYEKEAKRILDEAAKEANNILKEYIQLYGK
jgi:sn-glycerol 3-phosphate transport system substrate-binding protein